MKTTINKKWGVIIVALLLTGIAPSVMLAQDKVEASVGADLVSGYIWRGQDLGGVSIQPSLGIAYKGFSLGAWGSVGFESTDTKEFDLTLGYSTGGFSVSVTDYWFNTQVQLTSILNTELIQRLMYLKHKSDMTWTTGSQLVYKFCRCRRRERKWQKSLFFLPRT